ncbi:PD40 domain-containing protein, partial [Fulvivirga aurantia]|uniref:PD40 domain-containing protein n=1 Tax=Fulvivirga aurantia TaxID=2529383 RepID=UPI0016265879
MSYAQTKLKTLPANINRPSINLYAPYISGDGKTLIYLSDYTDDGHHAMNWTTKKTVSTWNDGQLVNRLINRPTLNFRGGYCLSFDGDVMMFSSLKSGLGGFDIWSSKRRGNDWEAPKNLGLPVNSKSNEGSPSLSPDGEYLFFMRCEKMKTYGGASDCKLYYSKQSYRGWSEPVELPANINTGNSQTPRLLADGETLIFSSDKMGGKGGLDLFMSKRTGENTWSDPVPFEFANTPEDDNFVSIPAKGRYMYRSIQGPRDHELVEVLIPEEFQPKSVMRIQGKITDENGEPLNAGLTIFNIDSRDRLWNESVGNKGEFAVVLNEGGSYDLSVDGGEGYMYYSKVYDLNEIGARDKQKLTIKLEPLTANKSYILPITFKPAGVETEDISIYELRRLGDFLRKQPNLKVEIGVYQMNYMEDSVKSDSDLTETRIDTIYYDEPYVERVLLTDQQDSLFIELKSQSLEQYDFIIDSMVYSYSLSADSLAIREVQLPSQASQPADSISSDSSEWVIYPPLSYLESKIYRYALTKYKLVTVYHNDRTTAQAK